MLLSVHSKTSKFCQCFRWKSLEKLPRVIAHAAGSRRGRLMENSRQSSREKQLNFFCYIRDKHRTRFNTSHVRFRYLDSLQRHSKSFFSLFTYWQKQHWSQGVNFSLNNTKVQNENFTVFFSLIFFLKLWLKFKVNFSQNRIHDQSRYLRLFWDFWIKSLGSISSVVVLIKSSSIIITMIMFVGFGYRTQYYLKSLNIVYNHKKHPSSLAK